MKVHGNQRCSAEAGHQTGQRDGAFVKHKLTVAIVSHSDSVVNRRSRYREKKIFASKCDKPRAIDSGKF
jgi:hypothetical protein